VPGPGMRARARILAGLETRIRTPAGFSGACGEFNCRLAYWFWNAAQRCTEEL